MKKLLFITAALISGVVSAQFSFTETSEVPAGLPKAWAGHTWNVIDDYVVIEKEGTAQQNYEMVKDFVQKTYVNPDKVIKSERAGDHLRIEFLTREFDTATKLLLTVEFRFKDGRIKIDPIAAFAYIDGTTYGNYLQGILIKNKKGKIRKGGVKTSEKFLQVMNEFVMSIEAFDYIEDKQNDW